MKSKPAAGFAPSKPGVKQARGMAEENDRFWAELLTNMNQADKPIYITDEQLQSAGDWLHGLFDGNSLHSGANNGIKDYESIVDRIPDINALGAGGGLIREDKRRKAQKEVEKLKEAEPPKKPNTASPYVPPQVIAAEKRDMEEQLSGADKKAGITVKVLNGACYYDYTDVVMKRLDEVLPEYWNHSLNSSPEVMELTPFAGSPMALTQTAQMEMLSELLFFYNQVNHEAPWDIKRDDPWKQQFGDIRMPYYNGGEDSEEFIFRGEKITRKALGNITYGYLGSAMGIPDWMLYVGGGYASKGLSVLNPFVLFSEDHGDSSADHLNVMKGIQYYYEDFPN